MKKYLLLASAIFVGAFYWVDRAQSQAATTDKEIIEALVIANRALASEDLGVIEGTSGHVSVRSPTNPNHFFLSRWIAPGMVTARDIIEYDLDGKPVAGDRKDQYLEKWIHSEVYKARPDVNAVVHAHTPELIAFGASSIPLALFDRGQDAYVSRGLPKWDIREFNGGRPGIVETQELGKAMAAALGDKPAILLVGHGEVVTSNSIYGLVGAAGGLRNSARLMLQAIQLGEKLDIKPPAPRRANAKAPPPMVPTGDGGGKGGDRGWEYWKWVVERELAEEAKGPAPPPNQVAKTRAELLLDLARMNRLLASDRMGVITGTSGHVSVRNPENPQHFFLSRYVAPGRVTPADIVEYDLDGNPVGSNRTDSYQERFIHAGLYRARSDVNSVLHAHTPELVAFSTSGVRLRAINNSGRFIGDGLPFFDIRKHRTGSENIVSTAPLGKALAEVIGKKDAALLPGHGIVVVAPTLYGMLGRATGLLTNARIEQMALALGGDVTYIDAPIPATAPPAPDRATGEGAGRAWGYWVRHVSVQ